MIHMQVTPNLLLLFLCTGMGRFVRAWAWLCSLLCMMVSLRSLQPYPPNTPKNSPDSTLTLPVVLNHEESFLPSQYWKFCGVSGIYHYFGVYPTRLPLGEAEKHMNDVFLLQLHWFGKGWYVRRKKLVVLGKNCKLKFRKQICTFHECVCLQRFQNSFLVMCSKNWSRFKYQ